MRRKALLWAIVLLFGLLRPGVVTQSREEQRQDLAGLWKFGNTILCFSRGPGTGGPSFAGHIVEVNPNNPYGFRNGEHVLKIYAQGVTGAAWNRKDPPLAALGDGEILSKANPREKPGISAWGGLDIFSYNGDQLRGRATKYEWEGEEIVGERYVPVTFTRLPTLAELGEELSKLERSRELHSALFELEDQFVRNLEALYADLYKQHARVDRRTLKRLYRNYEKQIEGKRIRELVIMAVWRRIDSKVSLKDLANEMDSVSLEIAKEIEGRVADDVLKPFAKDAHGLLTESKVTLKQFTSKFLEESHKTTVAIAKGVFLRELKKSVGPNRAQEIKAIEDLWRGLKRAKMGDLIEGIENLADIGKVYMDGVYFATLGILNLYRPESPIAFNARVRENYLDLTGRRGKRRDIIDETTNARREIDRLKRNFGKSGLKWTSRPLLLRIKRTDTEIGVQLDLFELIKKYHREGPLWTARHLASHERNLNQLENQIAQAREGLEKLNRHLPGCGTAAR